MRWPASASLLFSSQWPEPNLEATVSCTEGKEMWSLTGQPYGKWKLRSSVNKRKTASSLCHTELRNIEKKKKGRNEVRTFSRTYNWLVGEVGFEFRYI